MNKFPLKYTVYIIQSSEGHRYVGYTDNLEKRLKQHNDKSLSIWTRRGTKWTVKYFEKFSSRSEALKKEKWFKTGVGREFIKSLIEQ
jgi:putative endonuclease